jgi:hypothetical protein
VVVENMGGSIGAKPSPAPRDAVLMINGCRPRHAAQMAKVGYRDQGLRRHHPGYRTGCAHRTKSHPSLQQLIDEAPGTRRPITAAPAARRKPALLSWKIGRNQLPYSLQRAAAMWPYWGEVPFIFENIITASSLVKSGRARALMVTGAKPIEHLPGAVPFDILFPGLGIQTWHGIFAPSGTPRPVLEKAAADIRFVLRVPSVVSRFGELGIQPTGVSGDAFNAIVKSDFDRWGEVIRKNNLRAD